MPRIDDFINLIHFTNKATRFSGQWVLQNGLSQLRSCGRLARIIVTRECVQRRGVEVEVIIIIIIIIIVIIFIVIIIIIF